MVAERHFSSLRDRLDQYRPEPVEWLPVAVVTLGAGEKEHFSFQMDLKSLDSLLEVFGAIRADLVEVEKRLRGANLPAVRRPRYEDELRKED